jgi:hypothetical protein
MGVVVTGFSTVKPGIEAGHSTFSKPGHETSSTAVVEEGAKTAVQKEEEERSHFQYILIELFIILTVG